MKAAAFLAETGRDRIGRFREHLEEAAATPASEKAVHDLRVSIRRALAWTAVREELIGPAPELREARAFLKKLMSPLGKLRDAHVKRDAIRRHVPSGDRPSYLYAVLVASDVLRWEDRIRRLLRKGRNERIRIRVPKREIAPGGGIDAAAEASRLLAKLAENVAKHRKEALDPAKSEALHRMRLDFKRYRYAAEVFSPLFPRAGKAAAKRHQAFQTLLGTIHDCDVILAEARAFRREILGVAAECTLETAFRRLRDEKYLEFREIAGTAEGMSKMFGTEFRQGK